MKDILQQKKEIKDIFKFNFIKQPLEIKIFLFNILLQNVEIIKDNYNENLLQSEDVFKKFLKVMNALPSFNSEELNSKDVENAIECSEYLTILIDEIFENFYKSFNHLIHNDEDLDDFPTGNVLIERIRKDIKSEPVNYYKDLPEKEFGLHSEASWLYDQADLEEENEENEEQKPNYLNESEGS